MNCRRQLGQPRVPRVRFPNLGEKVERDLELPASAASLASSNHCFIGFGCRSAVSRSALSNRLFRLSNPRSTEGTSLVFMSSRLTAGRSVVSTSSAPYSPVTSRLFDGFWDSGNSNRSTSTVLRPNSEESMRFPPKSRRPPPSSISSTTLSGTASISGRDRDLLVGFERCAAGGGSGPMYLGLDAGLDSNGPFESNANAFVASVSSLGSGEGGDSPSRVRSAKGSPNGSSPSFMKSSPNIGSAPVVAGLPFGVRCVALGDSANTSSSPRSNPISIESSALSVISKSER